MTPPLAVRPMADTPLVFLDTETTSLDPQRRRVWDIAMIRREPDGTEDHRSAFVKDVDLADADTRALAIGAFYDRHPSYRREHRAGDGDAGRWSEVDLLAGLLRESEVAALVEKMTRGAYLVGAVPSFDALSLADMLRRHNLVPAWHYHLCCVETLAAGRLRLQPPWSHDEIKAAYGVNVNDPQYTPHTALGDARAVKALYDAVMAPDTVTVSS